MGPNLDQLRVFREWLAVAVLIEAVVNCSLSCLGLGLVLFGKRGQMGSGLAVGDPAKKPPAQRGIGAMVEGLVHREAKHRFR